jgi:hypothetical protein
VSAEHRGRAVVRVRYLLPEREDFEPCWPVLRKCFGEVRPAAIVRAGGPFLETERE